MLLEGVLGGTTIGAIVGAIATGALAKWIDVRGKRQIKQPDIAAELRDDLWEQNKEWEGRMKACQKECDDWRERYNKARDDYYDMRREVRRYEARYGKLDASEGPPRKEDPH